MADISALSGLRVLVVGLGREGKALALYLARHGFTVTATDAQPAQKLNLEMSELAEAGVSLVLGEHPLSLLDQADILFVSPGIPLEAPFLAAARSRGLPLSTESRLFCFLCPAPILGITGSSGKTTTTTLLGNILKADGRNTWVGGNIGYPLISVVDQITPDDIVVMELSSFQLEFFHARLNRDANTRALSTRAIGLPALLDNWSPSFSAILNITPNHLDRHPSMKHYVRAKRAIVDYQNRDDVTILNLDNDMTRTIGYQIGSRTRWFSLEAQVPNGACLVGDQMLLLDQAGTAQLIARRSEVKLRGRHNLSNILAACLMAREVGASVEAMHRVVTSFTGVEHRLQWVRERRQANYYNDSIATSPERLAAALASFEEPIVLLAGGRDKHLPWEDASRMILQKVRAVILFGEAAQLIAAVIRKARRDLPGAITFVHRPANLEQAVSQASQIARPGEVVLLSPGCTSYDEFRDFAERGERFKELVLQLD